MTEDEWKSFNKSPGTTVYVLDGGDRPQPWKIENVYRDGATLYKGQGLAKQWISRHYRQIISEAQKNSRICQICGEGFNPDVPRRRICPKCREREDGIRKEKDRARSRERYVPAKQSPKICANCGKEFMGNARRKTCGHECSVELIALHRKGLLGKFE